MIDIAEILRPRSVHRVVLARGAALAVDNPAYFQAPQRGLSTVQALSWNARVTVLQNHALAEAHMPGKHVPSKVHDTTGYKC